MKDDQVESNPDPWNENDRLSIKGPKMEGFEDSFAECLVAENSNALSADAKSTYVPLDDSEEYLAKLYKKINKFNRVNDSEPWTKESRKRVINFLTAMKQDQELNLLSSAVEAWDASFDDDDEAEQEVVNKGAVDPQGATGKVLRKCAPVRVALAKNELVKLLTADMLQKQHDKILELEKETGEDKESEDGYADEEYIEEEDIYLKNRNEDDEEEKLVASETQKDENSPKQKTTEETKLE